MANAFDQFDASNQPAANPFDQFGGSHTDPKPDVLGPARGGRSLDIMPVVRGAEQFFGAMPQGILGIPESIYQFGEHTIGLPRPGKWADPLRRYRDWSESTWPGFAGEMVGGGLGGMGVGALGDILGVTPKVARVITSPAVRTQLGTTVGSIFSQPSSGDDYWTQLGERAGLGYLFGRWLGRPTQQAERNVALKANERATQQEAADALLTKRLTAQDRERHQAAIADALTKRQGQVAAKAAVPADTTSNWWQRTLAQIGVTDPAATRAAPATGAKVRDIVGGHLNQIMEGMNLDRDDPALLEHLADIRNEVERSLPENERAGWYHEPPPPELNPLLMHPTTGKPLERTTRGVREKAPEPPSGTFYRTVIAPLKQGSGPLTGRDLTNYISRIGARAEELAKEAATVPRERRVILQAQADALRNVEDAIIGHAAGSAEQKTALETARRAYFMWAIGNDAARASRNGVATPAQLINSMTRRMRGEARYEQALNDPASPYHDTVNWLQGQLGEHTTRVPTQAEVRSGITPPPPRGTPPPFLRQEVPPEPNRPQRNIRRGVTEGAGAALLYALGHPIWAAGTAGHALTNIIGHGTGGNEKLVERGVRYLLENYPRIAGRVAVPAAGQAASGTQRAIPPKTRRAVEKVPQAVGKKASDMFYRWTSP